MNTTITKYSFNLDLQIIYPLLLQQTINEYNSELKELKEELESMKNVIAHTFEDELKTANSVHAVGGTSGSASKMSRKL